MTEVTAVQTPEQEQPRNTSMAFAFQRLSKGEK
jgi:hypothetical protein